MTPDIGGGAQGRRLGQAGKGVVSTMLVVLLMAALGLLLRLAAELVFR